ncbi:MAG: DNA-3-methyladenine glycosylase 2 family protein [Mogibacterium sp.]|nr:DNA-3-methyladenine glycosylase 2 family protein [Mogibacterium sp.]
MIKIDNVKDLDLTHIFECGQCFRWVPDGSGSYIGAAGSFSARISLEGASLIIDATGGDESFWRRYFDLDTDYGEIKRKLTGTEPRIGPATEYGCGIRILNQDLFETLISFIISQNNNIPRIRKNIESICEMYGEKIEGSSRRTFPKAEVLAEADVDDLASLRLGYRSAYIKASAERFLKEGSPGTREELLAFHGIGPKVANCIMLFGLRDTAAFPIDTWVRQIMNDMYGFDIKDTKGMQAFAAEKFGDYAGYAQQYLFYYYRDGKKMSNSSH